MSATRIAIILTKYAWASSAIVENSNVTDNMKIKCFIARCDSGRVFMVVTTLNPSKTEFRTTDKMH
jgi:hypothetical protein